MKIPSMAAALALVALAGGCAAEPFRREPLPQISNPDPRAIRAAFAQRLTSRRLTFDETVIIHAPFHDDLVVLGELAIDRQADAFDLVGLNPLGVTLFQLHDDRQGTIIRSAIPPLMEHRDLLLSVGQDIRQMYFNLVPSDNAQVDIRKDEVCFSQKTSQGKLVYEFGGEPPVLLDKHLDGFFGTIWRVRYYQYAFPGATLYPRGIVMDNGRFHYRIVVKNRAMEQQ